MSRDVLQQPNAEFVNTIAHGNCLDLMPRLASNSIDLILTDPPYGARYVSRDGRRILNDDDLSRLPAAFSQAYRVLRPNRCCISFYGWHRVDQFMAAWRAAGFRIVGHIVFPKTYASGQGMFQYQHEQAFLLAKGCPPRPQRPLPDVIPWQYSGNQAHPTQKPLCVLVPLVRAFSVAGDLVLDPFCGSGSALLAARVLGRRYYGIELDPQYHRVATARLCRAPAQSLPAA